MNIGKFLFSVALASSQAHSEVVIFGNMPGNDATQTALAAGRVKALSFTIGSQDTNLGSLVLRLENYDDALDTMEVELLNDIGGVNPGSTVLATFTAPAGQGAGITDYYYTPSSPFTLQASTKYWLSIEYISGDGVNWKASSPSAAPTGIATFDGQRYSTNSGATWGNSSIINSFQLTDTIVSPIVSQVPEPSAVFSTAWLLGCGLMMRRRKR
jgi:hypothetical protein